MSLVPEALAPRLWRVELDGSGDFTSLSKALLQCRDGDTVSVGEGVFSPSTTAEEFPLYVPTGVILQGQGDATVIDGDGWGRLSNRPLNPYESLVLMGDRCGLLNLCVQNSGGNAIAHLQGAHFQVSHCLVQNNGQHGVLLYGPEQASIVCNRFFNNGCRAYEPPPTPIPAPAKQGHHIYMEGMAATANRVVINNNQLKETFADGFALAPVFDDPEGVSIDVSIEGNTIDGSGRNGLTLSASYGTSNAVARVNVLNNVISNSGSSAISATAIFPLIPQVLKNVSLNMLISHNVMQGAQYGLNAVGSFSPATHGRCDLVISHNQICDCSKNGIFMATAIGDYHLPTSNNRLAARVFGNQLSACQDTEMVFHASQQTHAEKVFDNEMNLSLVGNSSPPGQIVLYDAANSSNIILLQDGSQGIERAPAPG